MKKVNITIQYEEEKLTALRLYMVQKGTSVETELTAALEVLYGKIVPANVREFIDLKEGATEKTEEKKKRLTPISVTRNPKEERSGDD